MSTSSATQQFEQFVRVVCQSTKEEAWDKSKEVQDKYDGNLSAYLAAFLKNGEDHILFEMEDLMGVKPTELFSDYVKANWTISDMRANSHDSYVSFDYWINACVNKAVGEAIDEYEGVPSTKDNTNLTAYKKLKEHLSSVCSDYLKDSESLTSALVEHGGNLENALKAEALKADMPFLNGSLELAGVTEYDLFSEYVGKYWSLNDMLRYSEECNPSFEGWVMNIAYGVAKEVAGENK